jgi:hypothetical protein
MVFAFAGDSTMTSDRPPAGAAPLSESSPSSAEAGFDLRRLAGEPVGRFRAVFVAVLDGEVFRGLVFLAGAIDFNGR